MSVAFQEFVEPDAETVKLLRDNLTAFNEAALGNYRAIPLMVTAIDEDGSLAGGVYGWLQFGWLYIHLLWVKDVCRRQKMGTRLMKRIEAMARVRGIARSRLATADFHPGFHLYRRLGYEVFAEIPFSSSDPGRESSRVEYLMRKLSL